MSKIGYDPKTWSSKELITADALNNIEEGVSACADKIDDHIVTSTYYAAAHHNSIYRGKALTSVYTIDEIHSMISANTFDDLYVGDYYDLSMTSDYATETVRWVFAGFNCFHYFGDTSLSSPHAVMVPMNCFYTAAAMNSSNTTEGAYVGSDMWTTVLPIYATAIQTAWGEDYVLSHRRYLSSTMTSTTSSIAGASITGASAACTWTDVTISLMNEAMVYGTTVCSSSRYDTDYSRQLPLFSLAPQYVRAGSGSSYSSWSARAAWWLSSVCSSTNFCIVADFGGAAYGGGASSSYGVRPYFLLG